MTSLQMEPTGSSIPLGFRPNLLGLLTMFRLALRQHVRGRKLLVLSVLFALPAVIAALVLFYEPSTNRLSAERALIFSLIPSTLLPLASLWYASGMIQDEVEEQTLTYLLMRPLPRWSIYLSKFLATFVVTSLLAIGAVLLSYAAIYGHDPDWNRTEEIHQLADHDPNLNRTEVIHRAVKVVALFTLMLFAYSAVFGFLSLLFRRSVLVGVAYLAIFEGVIANIPFVVRWITVMFYYRVLVERWIAVSIEDWSIDLHNAPQAWTCVGVLIGASVVLTCVAAATFAAREFRVKTPAGT